MMVRCRPMNRKEMDRNCKVCTDLNEKRRSAGIKDPRDSSNVRDFTYDAVFPSESSQQHIYEVSTFPILEAVFTGFNGTVFAYGQTGCGKTHTMMGPVNDDKEKGIIPRTFSHMLSVIEATKSKMNYLVRISFIEIYNEMVHDL